MYSNPPVYGKPTIAQPPMIPQQQMIQPAPYAIRTAQPERRNTGCQRVCGIICWVASVVIFFNAGRGAGYSDGQADCNCESL